MPTQTQPFGQTQQGVAVNLYTLTNAAGLEARITNYGGIIVSLRVLDRAGRLDDVVLGFDSLAPYLARHPYFGALVGRVANRTAHSRFTLNGVERHVTPTHGEHQLHGGPQGFDRGVWQARPSETVAGPSLELSHLSPDGDQGYPGNLQVTVTYTLTDDNALRIEYLAVPDQDTPVNLTNHSYFNLRGAGNGDILGHVLWLDADAYTPTDAAQITTGEIRPVAGTPFDFRQPTPIGARIHADDEQLRLAEGYDHNFVLNTPRGQLARFVEVYEPTSGRVMTGYTTLPGVQLYTGNKLGASPVTGKGGAVYRSYAALCLETQTFPNAVNFPQWPSPIVRAGERYHEITAYQFSTRDDG